MACAVWPVSPARIIQPFAAPGQQDTAADAHGPAGHHTGIDFGSSWLSKIDGRIVRSITDGEVMISESNKMMGSWIGIYNEKNNLFISYWHLGKRLVRKGQVLKAYTPIGRVGSTGTADEPHLHLQVNAGLSLDVVGHLDPAVAMKIWKRSAAKRRYLESAK